MNTSLNMKKEKNIYLLVNNLLISFDKDWLYTQEISLVNFKDEPVECYVRFRDINSEQIID